MGGSPMQRKRGRSRSPSPPAARCMSEWVQQHDNAVMALPPTPAMVKRVLTGTDGAESGVAVVKVAALDMDDTVVMPQTGKVFPKDDPADWKWVHTSVPSRLRLLHDRGFLITLLSNQSGTGKGGKWNGTKATAVKEKIIRISEELRVPLCALIAIRDDAWRKPNTSMWGLLQDYVAEGAAPLPKGTTLDCNRHSFYVGDAAGRRVTTLAGRAKDFSCSDRQFAHNLSLSFFTPEQFFLADEATLLASSPAAHSVPNLRYVEELRKTEGPFDWGNVGPDELRALPTSYDNLSYRCVTADGVKELSTSAQPVFARAGQLEMVLFVGYPGCGKSTFFRRFFAPHGYTHVNRDTLKTKEKCLAAVKQSLEQGRSVVVDNTNPTAADRLLFIKLAKAATPAPVPVRVCAFTHAMGMASHMNAVRSRAGISSRIPTIAYRLYSSKFEPISTSAAVKKEGIMEVCEIPPVAMFDGLSPALKREFYKLS